MDYNSNVIDIALNSDNSFTERFSKLRTLGFGAAGSVLLVKDRTRDEDDNVVALKILKNDLAIDEHTLKRFNDEAKICQEIDHPNIIRAYDIVRFEKHLAYTMEYIEGCDLEKVYKDKELSYAFFDKMFSELLSALQALHDRKIVHRDLKLENIILQPDGSPKLGDLGLLKHLDLDGLTKAGILLGTAQYMAPEYVYQRQFDERSDIYAVGIVLLEMLTKKRRLGGVNGNEAILYLTKNKFDIPEEDIQDLPHKYQYILRHACDPDPDLRYKSADEMRRDFHLTEEFFAKKATKNNKKKFGLKMSRNGNLGTIPKVLMITFATTLIFIFAVMLLSYLSG